MRLAGWKFARGLLPLIIRGEFRRPASQKGPRVIRSGVEVISLCRDLHSRCQRVRIPLKEVSDLLALGGVLAEYPQDAQAKDIPTTRAAAQSLSRSPTYQTSVLGFNPRLRRAASIEDALEFDLRNPSIADTKPSICAIDTMGCQIQLGKLVTIPTGISANFRSVKHERTDG